ncbi:hemerythrin domain-containing protein [Aquisalibacillus elongatus]|uniref:Hemerythrin-like domain-containing protein n=1 Tax=Aquisalibacillus elongatus TaxID=485577 RepID=A0A3N5C1G8_9BACI|nr:hemerythrin domain-containing protein [Aquisalibacillus elongatus]RPF53222.1 hemerythrin-like domain-containing protein [Aquisalibacillus elongatus]
MKRHEALNPLSHHHHHALVMALEMKRSGTEKSDKTFKQLVRDMIDFWENDGRDHFRDEEEVLVPLYLEHADSVEVDLVKEMLYQHVQIRSLIYDLREKGVTQHEKMRELGEILDQHIRLEERELFPLIEQAVPEKYLYQANGRFHRDSYSGF